MKVKVNSSLNFRKYKNKIIFLPKGDSCFVGNGVVCGIYELAINGIQLEELKNRLSINYYDSEELNSPEKIQEIVNKMLQNNILIEITN